jgi:osmotically-inducible protein OsmY
MSPLRLALTGKARQ